MDIESTKRLAAELDQKFPQILQRLTDVLHEEGFQELKVVGFTAAPMTLEVASFGESPLPTPCQVLPDGSIQCEPS